jgi:hypothetical protein
LFYDQAAGYGETWQTNGTSLPTKIKAHGGWRTSWTQIVAAEFVDNAEWDAPVIDDVFFYEGSSGYGEVYESDGHGGFVTLTAAADGFPPATQIVPGCFGGLGPADMLFFDAATGDASFQRFDGAHWSQIEGFSFGATWTMAVPGNFWMADWEDQLFPDGGFTDLLFYSTQGVGEFFSHEPPDPTPILPFDGYVSKGSVLPGETIDFHVSSQVGPFQIVLYRQDVAQTPLAQVEGLTAPPQAYPISRTAYETGAGWPAAGSFTVPENWPSGLYLARVEARSDVVDPLGGGGGENAGRRKGAAARFGGPFPPPAPLDIPFVVRAPKPQARILLAVADNTYSAYNFWGGRSVYGFGCSGWPTWVGPSSSPFHAPYGFRVSFLRGNAPMEPEVAAKWRTYELPLLQWCQRQGIAVDVCTESDLHKYEEVLDGYCLLLIVGHSEYWSGPMRDRVEGWVRKGGNVAFFAGNVCWWQVRFEDEGDTMVCYKQKAFDPASASPDTLPTTTVNWYEPYLNRPETQLTGVRYSDSGAKPTDGMQYTVEDASHWAFANTGLQNGNMFGLYGPDSLSVVGTETDCQVPDSPSNFHRLAHVRMGDGHEICTMGLFSPIGTEAEFRGVVFTAATIDWALGLSQDGYDWNPMDQITRNVLTRLG